MNFEKNLKIGRKAEKIVVNLFKEAGWKVYNYGWEYTLPKLVGTKIIGKAADYIRHMPDLVVVNERNEAFFIEVKFRSKGEINLDHIFNYPNSYVVLLNKQGILGQSTNYLYNKSKDFTYFINLPPFRNFSRDLLKKYSDKIRRELGDENLFGQIIEKTATKLIGKSFKKEPLKKANASVIKRSYTKKTIYYKKRNK